MSTPELPKDRVTKFLSYDPLYFDAENKPFWKGTKTTTRFNIYTRTWDDVSTEEFTTTPEKEGFIKSLELEVFVRRERVRDNDFVHEYIWLKGTLLIEVLNERRFRFVYLKSAHFTGIPCLFDIDGLYGSALDLTTSEFVTWKTKLKKLGEDEQAPNPQTQLCFEESGNGELRRMTVYKGR